MTVRIFPLLLFLFVQIQSQTGAKVMFIEVVNENAEFLEQRYADAAAFNPDYAGQCAVSSVSFSFYQSLSNTMLI